jgi:UTP--glucose-1-phosphate uridylyltransferase
LIRKVVIPAAGLGTRLFPATKEQPKEMLPIFSRSVNGDVCVKPLLQLIFEQMYEFGFREFCFVVGRGKRNIEDHFTPDFDSVIMLESADKDSKASDLDDFYMKLKTSTTMWVNQPQPKGFGDALLMTLPFVQNDHFLVHAGDTCIVSKNYKHLQMLMEIYERFKADAAFLIQEIDNPKQYGVIEAEEMGDRVYKVWKAVEKPEKPSTNLAIMPIYVFNPAIFNAIEKTPPGKNREIQLTDAIQKLIDWGLKVYAVQLSPDEVRLDIGNPETYWEALSLSHKHSCERVLTCSPI